MKIYPVRDRQKKKYVKFERKLIFNGGGKNRGWHH